MPEKKFKLLADQIEMLVEGMGACIATDRIVVDGQSVGYMYREPPDNEQDSGWRFLAGDESEDYMDQTDNHGVYSVNTIANYDREIVELVRSPIGSAFAREGANGELIRVDSPVDPDDCLHPDFPVVSEEYRLTDSWSIYLPRLFNRRVEEKSLVLWRPGLTIYFNLFSNSPGYSVDELVEQFKSDSSPDAYDTRESTSEEVRSYSYRLIEDGVLALYSTAFVPSGMLQMAIYFDKEDDIELAREIAGSARFMRD